MNQRLRLCFFAHSWISDWNHGNAHFLRGLVRELMSLGHDVRCYEEMHSWSVGNLVKTEGPKAQEAMYQFWNRFPNLNVRFYRSKERFREFAKEELRHADVVVLHEWNSAEVVNTILSLKRKLGYRVLLHDTHHRAYTNPKEILQFRLHLCDGVLAFGEAIRQIYTRGFGVPRAWTFHEAADTGNFVPLDEQKTADVVWIGNWGDEERARELEEFVVAPASLLPNTKFIVYGVRYPEQVKEKLCRAGIEYCGYLPNLEAPKTYGASRLALHVPRRQYANGLSGIPTIRVFEALACGIPLVCSPWTDTEGLFQACCDYVCVSDGEAMTAEISHLLHDEKARRQIAESGRRTILQRHTCVHRAKELLEICEELGR